MPDVVIIDGDHNYYTVSEELRLIGERAAGSDLPLLLFHDVCWPHGRRDDYFAPELIPEEYRQPIAGNGAAASSRASRGCAPAGVPYPRSAAREGGPRNGVLTAVEDFVAGREGLRLVVVPAFFGFGVVWHRGCAVGGRARGDPRPVGPQPVARAAGGEPRPPHRRGPRPPDRDLGASGTPGPAGGRAQAPARVERVRGRRPPLAAAQASRRGPTQPAVSKEEIRRALSD